MIAKDTGPTPEKAQRGDNTKKVSETEDKTCYTGKYLLLLERCLPTPGARTVPVNEIPKAMCFDNTNAL